MKELDLDWKSLKLAEKKWNEKAKIICKEWKRVSFSKLKTMYIWKGKSKKEYHLGKLPATTRVTTLKKWKKKILIKLWKKIKVKTSKGQKMETWKTEKM